MNILVYILYKGVAIRHNLIYLIIKIHELYDGICSSIVNTFPIIVIFSLHLICCPFNNNNNKNRSDKNGHQKNNKPSKDDKSSDDKSPHRFP